MPPAMQPTSTSGCSARQRRYERARPRRSCHRRERRGRLGALNQPQCRPSCGQPLPVGLRSRGRYRAAAAGTCCHRRTGDGAWPDRGNRRRGVGLCQAGRRLARRPGAAAPALGRGGLCADRADHRALRRHPRLAVDAGDARAGLGRAGAAHAAARRAADRFGAGRGARACLRPRRGGRHARRHCRAAGSTGDHRSARPRRRRLWRLSPRLLAGGDPGASGRADHDGAGARNPSSAA